MHDTPQADPPQNVSGNRWGWHQRGYLPHVDHPHLCQSVTFRLADALPAEVVANWKMRLSDQDEVQAAAELRRRIDGYEDAGHGACFLRDPVCAKLVEEHLLAGAGQDYRLWAWVVMPNHVHVLIGPNADRRLDLTAITRRWKGRTARAIHAHLGRSGRFWQPESFDRWIRDDRHFAAVVVYIENNPVHAGLCASPEEWRWSSAWERSRRLTCTDDP